MAVVLKTGLQPTTILSEFPKLPRQRFRCDLQNLPYKYACQTLFLLSHPPLSLCTFSLLPSSSPSSFRFSSSTHRTTMADAFFRALLRALAFVVIFFASASPTFVHAQSLAPAPTPTSDGTSIDQGIACVLMLVALVLTYLIHPLDASSYNFF